MLLPDVFERGLSPQVLLAFDSDRAALLGAIAFQTRGDETSLAGMRVIRTHRRRKIGTRLLSRLPGALISVFADSQAHPEAGPFFEANGFERGSRMFIVEVDLDPMIAAMTKLRDRALQSGRVPASARLVSPADAPAAEAGALYQEITAGRWIHPAHLEASLTDPRIAAISSVLLVDGHVAGMVVVRSVPPDQRVHVQARAVMPAFRGGWANVLIMADALEKGRAAGIRRIRFDSMDDNQDTLKLARRFNADTIGVFDRFTRRATAPPLL
jgi:GNAT superfamily N-acetyltransferase